MAGRGKRKSEQAALPSEVGKPNLPAEPKREDHGEPKHGPEAVAVNKTARLKPQPAPTQPPRPPKPRTSSPDERKYRLLTHGEASSTLSIAKAMVIKDDRVFFLADEEGQVPLVENHGLGLYFNDCRYLNGYALTLGGERPQLLVTDAAHGYLAILELTNPSICAMGKTIPPETVSIEWRRVVDDESLSLSERLTFRNFGTSEVVLPLELSYQSGFSDVFAVRGLLPEERHPNVMPSQRRQSLYFARDGEDGMRRRLTVSFSTDPESVEGGTVRFQLQLRPRETYTFQVSLSISETPIGEICEPCERYYFNFQRHHERLTADLHSWTAGFAQVQTDRQIFNQLIERALADLWMLENRLDGLTYFAAGIPWFATLFGRDSILSSLMTLAYNPDVAAHTLRLLARYQGKQVDCWREEEPGKILHELRVGELARSHVIPHTPFYGSVDATPLFLILLARHAAWTGSLELFQQLEPHVAAALQWIDTYGAPDGYVQYDSQYGGALINQGWKDSGDGIVDEDGRIAQPPIKLVEVQGYVYRAKREIAELYRRSGDAAKADALLMQAEALKQRFNRDFWLPDKQFFALCLQAGNVPSRVISSNPGHALWSGIVDEDKARHVVSRLLQPDMENGWGIRTLSNQERRFNPLGYHLGTVWPHDNAITAAGFRRYGLDAEAMRVFDGILAAATHFPQGTLPELFAGFARDNREVPVPYPVACHPQAWAATGVLYFLEMVLGLDPNGFAGQLKVVRPVLPATLDRLEFKGIRIANGRVDLRYLRTADGIAVQILGTSGNVEVVLETVT